MTSRTLDTYIMASPHHHLSFKLFFFFDNILKKLFGNADHHNEVDTYTIEAVSTFSKYFESVYNFSRMIKKFTEINNFHIILYPYHLPTSSSIYIFLAPLLKVLRVSAKSLMIKYQTSNYNPISDIWYKLIGVEMPQQKYLIHPPLLVRDPCSVLLQLLLLLPSLKRGKYRYFAFIIY